MSRFLQHNILIFVLINSGNVFTYVFQMFLGRSLTPAEFGSFNAVFSLGALVGIPTTVISLVLAKFAIRLERGDMDGVRGLLRAGLRWAGILGVAAFGLGMASSHWVRGYLHLETIAPLAIIFFQVGVSMIFPVFLGLMQGLQRFFAFGVSNMAGGAGRLGFGVLLLAGFGLGVNGALLAGVGGVLLAIGVAVYFLRDIVLGPANKISLSTAREMGLYVVPVLLNNGMVLALGTLDLVLARHYCTPEGAGHYATAAILGRIALYLPNMLLMVLFPAAARARKEGRAGKRAVWISLGLTALLAGGFALACALWPGIMIRGFVGHGYAEAASILRPVALAMALLAVSSVLFTYNLAVSRFGFLWVLGAGLAGLLVLAMLYHRTPMYIAWELLGATTFIFLGGLAFFWVGSKQAVSAEG